MPKPILKDNNITQILKDNIKLLSEIDKTIKIHFTDDLSPILFNCDKEQIGRVFFNLIKNSIESIQQKSEKNTDFKKKISIEIKQNNDHIKFVLIDNGIGLKNINGNIKDILNPYYTTKKWNRIRIINSK